MAYTFLLFNCLNSSQYVFNKTNTYFFTATSKFNIENTENNIFFVIGKYQIYDDPLLSYLEAIRSEDTILHFETYLRILKNKVIKIIDNSLILLEKEIPNFYIVPLRFLYSFINEKKIDVMPFIKYFFVKENDFTKSNECYDVNAVVIAEHISQIMLFEEDCLIFLKDDLLYLEMHNFSINNVIFLNTNTQLNLKNYTGHYTIGSNSIEDLFTIYYFQLTKSVAQSNVQTDIIKRVYKNSKQLSISDATSKYKAYELLVTEGFFPENADYKWLIKVDTYDKLIDYITDYCFRKMLPLDSMYEHNLKEIIWNYIDPTYESHIIDNGNSEDLSIFLKDNISFFESFNRFKNKEYNDDLEFEDDRIRDEFNKQFNIAISNYKKNVSIRRFNFIFKPFFQNESKQELTFKELQILNCLIDTYTYIRDLYFPNYNKES